MTKRKFRDSAIYVGKLILVTLLLFSLLGYEASSFATETDPKFNMSYVYFGNTASYIQQVKNTNGAVNTVAPSYFDLRPDGSLHNKIDPAFVTEMNKMGVRVVPFLSNHWDRELGRKALANRHNLAKQITQVVLDYNLDGVNIDIENVTHLDKDNFTDLVRLLRQYLPADKEVSVAVAANPNNWQTGWHGSYDYRALAKYSDYLMVMTYDESYQRSLPGPVASISFVERSIQQLLNQQVPPDKIVLGIPFFARYWNTDLHHTQGGFGIGSNTVDILVERYNGEVFFVESIDGKEIQSPYATFTIRPGDPVTRLNFRDLGPGNYVVWFENLASIEKKIELVHKYNLKGTGSWSLNQAPVHIWDYYNAWLQGTGYVDLNHWAKDDILEMIDRQWMIGTSKNHFSPNANLTRAQVATILVRALGIDYLLLPKSNFKDIDGYWAEQEIELAYQHGLVKGRSDSEFAPRAFITREELAELLTRVIPAVQEDKSSIALSEVLSPIFADLDTGHWAYPSISILAQRNILLGHEGSFRPKHYTSRAEFASVMNRMLKDETINYIFK
ncbi:glycosyl hydrolase family 18 protein [Desulfuribacillus alkaliarsenatis]|uniref:Glycoside hydrolase n=1 Tax=Desulfuribacillus alkaliarsenatis TaxID=766136 RepID=A0A1E5G5R8_9FIRM|nr:glycosyl hydrolase family 18 protein [Desulfuribacillus alkaliarsenatis]OEF98522.1 hypothetical protein BHF68_02335 [Desulfuribacillus alkaliarsenatis]